MRSWSYVADVTDIHAFAAQLREHLGATGEPATTVIERSVLRKFAVATDDPHLDHHSEIAAPTFVAALRAPLPDLPQPEEAFRSHLHTNDELELFSPIRVGDSITTTAELTDVFVKEGSRGPMLFSQVTFRSTRGGELVSTVAWTEVQHQ